MSTMFLLSYFALWALFILQSVVILLLLRQVGTLHLRIAPAGARVMPAGPEIGEPVSAVSLEDLDNPNEHLQVSGSMEEDLMLLFVAPRCAVCASIMPAVKQLVRESRGDPRWAVVAYGERDSCRKFRQEYGLHYLLFAYAPDVRDQYKVGLSPYAILIRKDGVVISKGLVNQMEHLESVLEVRNQASDTRENELDQLIGRPGRPQKNLVSLKENRREIEA